MAKVSVIVPIYNVEKYLSRCLDSLVNQTLKDIEIILVDDESPDNCGKICDEYAEKDNRIKVLHKKNEGVSAARNDGIKISTSEWIMFVDSDDWCEVNMCEVAYENAIKYDADISIFNYYNDYQDFEEINTRAPKELILDKYENIEVLQMTMFHYNFIRLLDNNCKVCFDLGAPWSKIFKKSVIINNDLKFDLGLKGLFDDVFFCLNVLQKSKKVVYKNVPLYHWRRLDNTLSTSFNENNLEKYNNITAECEKFIKVNNKTGIFEEAYYARLILNITKLLKYYFFNNLNEKKLSTKLKELKETIYSYPYNVAIKNVHIKYLSKNEKMYVIFFRMRMPFLAWIFYKLYHKIKKE